MADTGDARGVAEYGSTLYLLVTVVIRIGWVVVAVGNVSLLALETVVFAWEVVLLGLLVYEVHPNLVGGLLSADDPYFQTNRGSRVLLTLTAVAMPVPFLAQLGEAIHLPHAVGAPLHHAVPGIGTAVMVAVGLLFGFGAIHGLYLYWQRPRGYDRISSILWTFSGAGADAHTRVEYNRLQRAIDAPTPSFRQRYYRWTAILVAGVVLTLAAALLGFLLLAVLLIPKLLVGVVLAWVVYDLLTHTHDLESGVRDTIWELSEVIEEPKKWFLAIELDRLGLKAAFAFLYLTLGIVGAALILSFFLQFTLSIGYQLPGLLEAIYTVATTGAPATVPGYWRRLTLMGTVAITSTLIVVTPVLLGGYFLLVWYALLRRLTTWATRFPRPTESTVDTYHLPWQSDVFIPVCSGGYLLILHWYQGIPVDEASPIVTEWVVFTPIFLAFTILIAYALLRGLRSLAIRPASVEAVARDNHRIPAYLSVFFLSFGLFGGKTIPAIPDFLRLLPLLWMVYYIPDAEFSINARVTGYNRASLLHATYLAGTIGLLVLTIRVIHPASQDFALLLLLAIPVLLIDQLISMQGTDPGEAPPDHDQPPE